MNESRSKLPESFGVIVDESHPRWNDCILVMNQWFGGDFEGSCWKYYGVTSCGDYDGWDQRSYFDVIISIDQFFEMIDGNANISNYQYTNMKELISKLPKSFGIKENTSHPRWNDCISTMDTMFDSYYYFDNCWEYYGVDIDGSYEPWDSSDRFDVIITVEEFFQIIGEPTNISNYQIY